MTEQPTLRIVVCGPGRVGRALGAGWVAAGLLLHGYYGPNPRGAAEAAAAVGGGSQGLDAGALAELAGDVDVLVLAVPDDRLVEAVEEWANRLAADWLPAASGKGLLCLHTSGAHGLDVFAPMRKCGAAVRFGAFHPVCPVPAGSGPEVFAGRPVVIELDPPGASATGAAVTRTEITRGQLETLAAALRLQPHVMDGGDRLLYHTACVLSANGLTALFGAVTELFAEALPGQDAIPLAGSLMRSALDACVQRGAGGALTGPVARGDSGLVGRQVDALQNRAAGSTWGNWPADAYLALMRGAAELASSQGELSPAAATAMREALGRHG